MRQVGGRSSRVHRSGSLLAFVLLVAGCAIPSPRRTPSPVTPSPETTSNLTPVQPEDVLLPGAEGLALHGTWRSAGGGAGPAVLLLPMYGGRRQDWDSIAESLQQARFASLAIDLRGQGDTGGTEDWTLAVDDVAAAQDWLAARPEVDPQQRGTVGASIGANLALAHAARHSDVRAVALLSPGLDYFRVSIEGLMDAYGDRPILLVASEKDGYSAETVQTLADQAEGRAELIVYPGGAHGTELFFTQTSLIDTLIEFLRSSLER
jgi:dienelactone hydrolase